MAMLWGADRSKDTPRCAPYPSAHGEKAASCTANAVGHRGAAPSAVLEGRLPRAADFRAALAEAETDAARQNLAADIIAAYRPHIEAVLAHYAGRALPLREVERIRLSRGLRELGACRIRRADDGRCVLAFSRHLFFPGNEENLVSVVCHEMLHACLPYGEGHGTHFRFFMRKLNEALGLSLAVHSAETTIRPNAARYRYRVTCGVCGNAFCYLRAGAIVRHPGRYRCARCGASAFTVETLR